ncbi:MAG: DUF167 domain-containing protein [Eggerthellaceae bacterium]|nr:DUF167 domain-containing protein [Eggerthellaceae bacterium]
MSGSASIALHVTPRSSRDEVLGVRLSEEGMREIAVRVTAPTDGGKANAAVCKLIAKTLGVAKSAVRIKRGDTSRHKLVEVDAPAPVVERWIDGLSVL